MWKNQCLITLRDDDDDFTTVRFITKNGYYVIAI